MEIFIILVVPVLYAAFVLGYNSGMRKAANIVQQFTDNLKSEKTLKIPMLIAEETDSDILICDYDGSFVCQGKSLEAAAESVLSIAKIDIAAVVLNENKYWVINGKIFDYDDEQVKNRISEVYANKNT